MNLRERRVVRAAAQGGSGGMPTESCYGQSNVVGTRALHRLLNTATVSLPKGICNKMNSEPIQDRVGYKRPYERSAMRELVLSQSVIYRDLNRGERCCYHRAGDFKRGENYKHTYMEAHTG